MFLPALAQAGTYRCVSLDYPPLIYKDSDNRVKGFAVDIVSAVFKNLGHTIEVEIYPWARSLEMLRTGERDCIFTIFHSQEREQFLDFSAEAIVPQVVYFYTKKDSPIAFNGDIASLADLRIGTVRKISYGQRFDDMRARLKLDEAYELEQSMKKLLIGRIDLFPSNYYSASHLLKLPRNKDWADKIVQLPVAVDVVPSYLAFAKSKKMTSLRDSFDQEFRKFLTKGQYRDLLIKYQLENSPELIRFLQNR
ncbi:substrate-binding periplasmic protein [Undibacterium sp. Di27W]|uniref:substrate-binding periplasmic protein n=1 Tax=Undibacterium sp. Di27W TaxID=3413036 RepID=UPI003BF38287